MKKFSEIIEETILENESKRDVDLIINEGIVDGFKKLANASKEKLISFKTTFSNKTKDILSKTLSALVKSLISSIQTKKTEDIKPQLEQNPLFKEFLSETNAINEITSDFNKNAVKSVIGKKDDVAVESIQYSNKNIISEDISDSIDTITTKIFSAVYKIISGTLEKIGYVIKPDFRNWYDKLVRKIQKKFYTTKLGQSINDLPPEVKDGVMERFQAIIGIVVIVIMVWIIVSTLKGENVDETNSSNENLDNVKDTITSDSANAASIKLYFPDNENIKTEISYANEPKEIYDMKIQYINERYQAIKKAYPNLYGSSLHAWRHKASLEFDASFAHGKLLKIEDGKIIRTDINSEFPSHDEMVSNEYSDMTHNADRQSKYEVLDRKSKISDGTISFFSRNQQALQKLENNYVNARLEALQQSNDIPNEKIGDIKFNLKEEFRDAYYHGKILSIKDNKIVETNSDSFINLSNNIDTLKNIGVIKGHVADFSSVSPTLLDNISIKSFIKNGITDIKFIDRNINVNLEIDRIPKNMLNLNAKEIADKVIREYANAHRDNVLNGL